MVVCLLPTSRTHGPRLTVQGSRCCGSAPVKVCASFVKCVPGIFSFLAHNIPLYINDLTKCVPCVPCVPPFLSSFKHVSVFSILSFKSNFDLKLVAHMAHISESRTVAHFLLFQFWHTLRHTPGTHPLFLAHIPKSRSLCPLTADHEQRTTNQAYRFALHAHRSVFLVNWLILTDSLLVVVLFRRRNQDV